MKEPVNIQVIFDNLPVSHEESCSYFPEKLSRLKYAIVEAHLMNDEIVQAFTDRGYRRSSNLFYNTVCKDCHLCIPYRIPLPGFKMNSSQKRNLKKNSNFKTKIQTPEPNAEKERLYIDYMKHCHPNEDSPSYDDEFELLDVMYSQMYSNEDSSLELEVWNEEKLIGFGILDIGKDLVSAVYNVYDPNFRKSGLGIFMILKSIEWAQTHNFAYFHLGLWIPNHPKMDYKKQFGPSEILDYHTKQWIHNSEA